MRRVRLVLPGLLAVAIALAATLVTSDRALAQPTNDNFADRVTISSLPFTESLITVGATLEAGEPQPCGLVGSTVWYEFTPSSTVLNLHARTVGSDYDTVLAVWINDPFLPSPLLGACDDDSGPGFTSQVSFPAAMGVTYYFQVGGFGGAQGNLVLNVAGAEGPPSDPTCSDGIDNDLDSAIDAADSGCQTIEGPAVPESCFDGVDNDGDGLIDSFEDPDCFPVLEGPPGGPTCSDGLDNDFDGAIDDADSGCQAIEGPSVPFSCADGIDNDGDGLVDSDDPACVAPLEGPPGDPSCSDNVDNDGDGLIDAVDSGCQATEGPSAPFSCFDRVDNDGDGLTDFQDPDCAATTEGPPGDPTCSDGIDNDFDTAVDGADSGCQATEGPPFAPSCSDGVDNDGDGLVDFQDPDCVPPPEGPPGDPNCSDAIDNDFDGLVDGADSGCQTTEGPPFSLSCFDGVDNDSDGQVDEADSDCVPPPPPAPPPLPCVANPAGGTTGWSSLTPLPFGREGETGVVIGDRIYVTHGTGPPFGDDNSNFVYDRPSDTWYVGARASQPRSELAGVCAEGADGVGRVYAIGGRFASVLNTNERYDPVTNTWTTVAPMPTTRAGLCTVWVPSQNKVYAIGGRGEPTPGSGLPLAANERYDPVADMWVARAPMPVPMMDVYSCAFHPGTGKIYVIGGFDGSTFRNDVQVYDPFADAWLAPGAPMPTARSNAIAGVCGGDIYVIGGYDGTNLAVNERYDPVANAWTTSDAKPSPASEMASTAISTGAEIYAIGSGIFGASLPFNERFICEPAPTPCPGGDDHDDDDDDGDDDRRRRVRDEDVDHEESPAACSPCIADDIDFDDDGTNNRRDRDDDSDGTRDTRDRDDDNDGIRDSRDSDDDNDGIPDREDRNRQGAVFCPNEGDDDEDDN